MEPLTTAQLAQMNSRAKSIDKTTNRVRTGLNVIGATAAVVGADKFIKHAEENPDAITGKITGGIKSAYTYVKDKVTELLKLNDPSSWVQKQVSLIKSIKTTKFGEFVAEKAGKAKEIYNGLPKPLKIAGITLLALIGVSHIKRSSKIEGQYDMLNQYTGHVDQARAQADQAKEQYKQIYDSILKSKTV